MRRTGKNEAKRIPILKFSPNRSETKPTTEGPLVQPMSPPRARRANIAPPPPLMFSAAILYVPGHMMPTEKPQSAMPKRANAAEEENAMIR